MKPYRKERAWEQGDPQLSGELRRGLRAIQDRRAGPAGASRPQPDPRWTRWIRWTL